MKNKVISIVFYLTALIFIIIYFLLELTHFISMKELARLLLLCLSCLFLYFGGLYLSKYRQDNKAMQVNLWLFFFLYCFFLLTLTLFDPSWGRKGLNILNWNKEKFNYYLHHSTNFIPLKTIIKYLKNIFTSSSNLSIIIYNLLGNLVCLMPLSLFTPMLFKHINSTKQFTITILCITFGIEITQLLNFTGICDIDDIILNTLGAIIAYKILNIKYLKKVLNKIFLLEEY